MSKWISVKDKLPEDGEYIVTAADPNNPDDVHVGWDEYHKDGNGWIEYDGVYSVHIVTHYQPLPEPFKPYTVH